MRIELARLAGGHLDVVAARFGINPHALWRHMQNHVTEANRAQLLADLPIREMARKAAEDGASLIEYLGVVRNVLMRSMLGAAEERDRTATASLSGRAIEVLREIGKITGEISRVVPYTQINNNAIFINSPVFVELQAMLIDRLATFPEALAAVIEGLRELEGRAAPDGPVIEQGRLLGAEYEQVHVG
jgi:hypothetical protein